MGEQLTPRQRSILEFIRSQISVEGRSPTVREICAQFNFKSTNGARDHLKALIKKGYLERDSMLSRGIRLVERIGVEVGRLPLVGSAPAGAPITAIENYEGEIAVDKSFISTDEAFTLRIVGDSMKNAGIEDGDLVIVRKQAQAKQGEIVVAVVDEDATVKRIDYGPGGKAGSSKIIRLLPENESYQPIEVDITQQDFYIAGVVEGLMRRF